MSRKTSSPEVDHKAVEVAAKVMQYIGLCRHNSRDECKKETTGGVICERCIKNWLLSKARKELKEEAEAASRRRRT